MRTVYISDITMKEAGKRDAFTLSFREKLELGKLLDRLGVSAVETAQPENSRTDALLLKSLSTAVVNAALTVPIPLLEDGGAAFVAQCLREAKRPRLQVALPVSTVQMEYLFHRKPDAMLDLLSRRVLECREVCGDVEFLAQDAGRADPDFLLRAIECAVDAGATTVTCCDTAGTRLPEEFRAAVTQWKAALRGRSRLGVEISNDVFMANSCAISAIQAGADEVKAAAFGDETVSLQKLATVLRSRGEDLGVCTGIHTTELSRTVAQIEWLCKTNRSKSSPFDHGVQDTDGFFLNAHDDRDAVRRAAEKLGYALSREDVDRVYEAFVRVAEKKERIGDKELDILIAASALQVPPTYLLESYVINSGNQITSTSHIRLRRGEAVEAGVCVGDGPIDASFLAIEQIVGTHYELDDFQIRAVTEGREAMGEAVVRLRHGGRLYSGRGISTDIVGSSIRAYINALNKIVYEETEQ